ncbi:lipocalin family protein [Chryseobacterium sp. CFBP8996]|uniref:lipocalin family protein n=1 Tax=Chryseobacterium sp. CFBP8996 TaxID=3096529 RepID=UPI002A6B04D8|nr:lipocalin family protein [Chryseobacterium sp. CFBP8996]MDY0932021.1 lipocalin family protein [Chryseobacterium sp. CFBP8996]
MKKNFLLAFATIFLLTSCGNDDNENNQNAIKPIVGNWKMSRTMMISGSNNAILRSSPVSGCEALNTFEFGQNQSFSIKYYTKNNMECIADGFDTGTYQYSENSKMLTFTYSDSMVESSVVHSLNSIEMMTVDHIEDYNDDGVNDTSVILFKKQQ